MRGTPEIPFTALVADTIRAHGRGWARAYYLRRGLSIWEWAIFSREV